jgi:hypothetical protein
MNELDNSNEIVSNEILSFVKSMRNANTYKEKCINETDLLNKCILCKQFMSSQEWSCVMEQYIKKELNIDSKKDEVSGDGCKNGKNIEIKVSLGCINGQMNFVQLRPDHNIDYYLFVGYNLFEDTCGKVYTLLIPSENIYELIINYGSYSHGTVFKLGNITRENIKGRNCEYSLRPNPELSNNCKYKKLWIELLKYQKEFNSDLI